MKPRSIPSLTALASRFGFRQSAFLFATAVAGLLSGPQASAANRTWSGLGADANWGTSGNWSMLPVTGQDTLVFTGNVQRTNVNNLAADFAVTGLSFTHTVNAQPFTITGNRITLGGNISTTAAASGSITDSVNLAMILTANRTVTTGTNHNINLLGVISGTGFGLTKAGAASLSLQGANTFTGAVTVNEGTLNISNGGSILTASGLTVATGQTLTLSNSSAANNLGNRISDSQGLTFNGINFNFNNTAVAATNYSETIGALSIASLANTIGTGQAAASQSSALTFASLARSGAATLNFTGTGIGSTTDARNRVLFTAAPTLTNNLIGAWATIGSTAATGGVSTGAADWASYDATNGVTPLAAGSYTSDIWSTGNNTTVTTSSAPSSDSTTNSLRFNLTAANTVTLSGVNTISSGGILVAGAVGANTTTITGGTIQGSPGGELVIHQFNTSGTSTVNAVAGVSNAVPGVSSGFLTIASVIQDNGSATGLVKSQGGLLILTGANTYTGVTTITGGGLSLSGASETIKGNITIGNSGRVGLGADNQIADTSVITFVGGGSNSGRFQLNGKNDTIGGVNDSGTTFLGSRLIEASNDSIFNLPLGTLTINTTGSNSYTFGGLVRDTAGVRGPTDVASVLAITKSGTGTQVFSGTSGISYSGATTITGGILRFSGSNNNNSEVVLSGGSVEYNGITATRSGLITGTSSSGGFIKSGANVFTLSGVNTYQSPTTITGGTLALASTGSINNSPSITVSTGATYDVSAVTGYTVGSAQTLAGNGNVTGAVSISGAHSPGVTGVANGVGTQTFSSTLNYDTGSIFEWDFNATPGVTGVAADAATGTYDQVVATGAITGGAAIFKVVLGGNTFADAFWDTDKSWTNIFSGAGTPANLAAVFSSFSATGGLDTSGTVASRGQFTFNGSTSTLNWSAVPEPTSALAGLLLGVGLLRRRRD